MVSSAMNLEDATRARNEILNNDTKSINTLLKYDEIMGCVLAYHFPFFSPKSAENPFLFFLRENGLHKYALFLEQCEK